MRALLARSTDEGAIGLAPGLIDPPSAFGTTDELAALCEVVRDKGGLYASHIRNESTHLRDAVEENLEIGRRSRVRVELSHHKASGQKNWGKVKESTALIERARRGRRRHGRPVPVHGVVHRTRGHDPELGARGRD